MKRGVRYLPAFATFLLATLTAFAAYRTDYEVISIVAIGSQPARVSLVRLADNERLNLRVGDEFDGLTMVSALTLERQSYVQVEDSDKQLYLIGMQKPYELPFPDGPLLESFNKGFIDHKGKLTADGKKRILNNLRMFASAGQQYILEHGVTPIKPATLIGTYIPQETIVNVAGESYTELQVIDQGGTLGVETLFGETVEFVY